MKDKCVATGRKEEKKEKKKNKEKGGGYPTMVH